jgi:hypothetical protein
MEGLQEPLIVVGVEAGLGGVSLSNSAVNLRMAGAERQDSAKNSVKFYSEGRAQCTELKTELKHSIGRTVG